MNTVDLLGWIAFGLNLVGNLLLALNRRGGWPIRLACNVAFFIYSWETRAWALLANHGTFALVNCYGWYKWKKKGASR